MSDVNTANFADRDASLLWPKFRLVSFTLEYSLQYDKTH